MSEQKLLSVIVPVYGVEIYLEKCVRSILAQTYRNLEIILVDDGSPDRCPEMCDAFVAEDERVVVIHKENGGQGSARNRALDIAKGDYIAFVDSDDYIEPNMYEVMIEALERTDSDISFCGFISHSDLRCIESSSFLEEHLWENAEQLLEGLFRGTAAGNPCNKVCKRALFDGLRYPEGVAREDIYIMHMLYGRSCKAVHTGKCLYHYLIREGSSEHRTFHPKFLISLQIADARRDYIQEHFPRLLPLAQRSCYGARISAIKKIVRSDGEKQFAETLRELKEYLRDQEPQDKEQKKMRFEILYVPLVYKLRMNMQHKWRNKIKRMCVKLTRCFKK